MHMLILYQPASEHSRVVEEFVHDFERLHPDIAVELVDVDSIDGADKAQLYDVVRYPSVLVITDTGGLQNAWSGDPLPLMDEVVGYLHA